MKLNDRVKQLINEKGVTVYEVSVRTGISQATLSRILNNSTAKMMLYNIYKLADYFNVSRDWLNSGKGEKTKKADPIELKDRVYGLENVRLTIMVELLEERNAKLEKQVGELLRELAETRAGTIQNN